MNSEKTKIYAFFVAMTIIFLLSFLLQRKVEVNEEQLPKHTDSISEDSVSHARAAAQEGVGHVINMRLAGALINEGVLIPETSLNSSTSYEVEVLHDGSEKLIIMSRGRYTASDNTTYEYPIRVVLSPESD